jgi:integrase
MTRLKQAYEKLEMRMKTWHCLRHSRGTFLFGETGDRELAKIWLGHGSNKVFERYNHTFQQMVRNAKRPKPRREDDFESWLAGKSETSVTEPTARFSVVQ